MGREWDNWEWKWEKMCKTEENGKKINDGCRGGKNNWFKDKNLMALKEMYISDSENLSKFSINYMDCTECENHQGEM